MKKIVLIALYAMSVGLQGATESKSDCGVESVSRLVKLYEPFRRAGLNESGAGGSQYSSDSLIIYSFFESKCITDYEPCSHDSCKNNFVVLLRFHYHLETLPKYENSSFDSNSQKDGDTYDLRLLLRAKTFLVKMQEASVVHEGDEAVRIKAFKYALLRLAVLAAKKISGKITDAELEEEYNGKTITEQTKRLFRALEHQTGDPNQLFFDGDTLRGIAEKFNSLKLACGLEANSSVSVRPMPVNPVVESPSAASGRTSQASLDVAPSPEEPSVSISPRMRLLTALVGTTLCVVVSKLYAAK